jgi:hypothetical protein
MRTLKINLEKFWLLSLIFLSGGCAPNPTEVAQEWIDKGWTLVRTHGEVGPIKRHGKLMSKQAQAVEASWIQNGKRKTKIYPQDNHWVLVLRFFKKDGDEFAVVLRRRK